MDASRSNMPGVLVVVSLLVGLSSLPVAVVAATEVLSGGLPIALLLAVLGLLLTAILLRALAYGLACLRDIRGALTSKEAR